jgi:metal-responsive CopG/Arc/MetJ family transcriptional regulator
MNDPDYADAAAIIMVTVSGARPGSVRVNITVPEDMLRKIDSMAKKKGMSRSAFLVRAARSAIPPGSDSLSQQYFGGIV